MDDNRSSFSPVERCNGGLSRKMHIEEEFALFVDFECFGHSPVKDVLRMQKSFVNVKGAFDVESM